MLTTKSRMYLWGGVRSPGQQFGNTIDSDGGDYTAVAIREAVILQTPVEIPLKYPEPYLQGHRNYPELTHPEYRNYVYEKEYICPHCGMKFEAMRILYSKLASETPKTEESRYDLHVFYREFEVEWYEIITCPHCYFSALEQFFREYEIMRKNRYEEELVQLRAVLYLDFEKERSLNFVFAQHYLAMVCAAGYRDIPQNIAHLWDNLRWLYKDAGDKELAQLAEKNACEAYQQVYYRCRLSEMQEQRVCLMIAGMLYRAGDVTGVRQWAIAARSVRNGKRIYSDMALDLIEEARSKLWNDPVDEN